MPPCVAQFPAQPFPTILSCATAPGNCVKPANLSEVLLWQNLNKGQFRGYDFDRQKIIGNFIVDFYCLNCNAVIEVDGSSHDNKVEYDQEREAFLVSLGLTVLHIPAEDVLYRLDSVMEMLYAHPALKEPV